MWVRLIETLEILIMSRFIYKIVYLHNNLGGKIKDVLATYSRKSM